MKNLIVAVACLSATGLAAQTRVNGGLQTGQRGNAFFLNFHGKGLFLPSKHGNPGPCRAPVRSDGAFET